MKITLMRTCKYFRCGICITCFLCACLFDIFSYLQCIYLVTVDLGQQSISTLSIRTYPSGILLLNLSMWHQRNSLLVINSSLLWVVSIVVGFLKGKLFFFFFYIFWLLLQYRPAPKGNKVEDRRLNINCGVNTHLI